MLLHGVFQIFFNKYNKNLSKLEKQTAVEKWKEKCYLYGIKLKRNERTIYSSKQHHIGDPLQQVINNNKDVNESSKASTKIN